MQQYFANTGLSTVTAANPALTGAPPTVNVLTGGLTGTTIDKIIVKAQGGAQQNIIRLFIDDTVNVLLYKEVSIPAVAVTGTVPAYETVLNEQIILKPGYILKASTDQPGVAYNIIANGTDWNQCNCAQGDTCCAEIQQTAHTGIVNISVGTSSMTGVGSTLVLTSPVGALRGGTFINYVNIKCTNLGAMGEGMIRLFIDNGAGTKYLFSEIPIPATFQTGIQPAYRTMAMIGLYLQPGYSLYVSTENTNNFNIWADAVDMVNCTCVP